GRLGAVGAGARRADRGRRRQGRRVHRVRRGDPRAAACGRAHRPRRAGDRPRAERQDRGVPGRGPAHGRADRRAARTPGRHRAAGAGLRQLRPVSQLRGTRPRFPPPRGGARHMSLDSATMPFPARLRTRLQPDPAILGLALAILLGGLVVLASASISISDNVSGDPFFYVRRQALAAVVGVLAAWCCVLVPMSVWQSLGPLLLLAGVALLAAVFVPGLGYEVNGATRWLRAGVMNVQVSEPARLCLILYLAGYLVRRNRTLREQFTGFLRPMLLLTLACALLLAEPDFGAAIVLLATALTMLFVAGARLRDFFLFFGAGVIAMTA